MEATTIPITALSPSDAPPASRSIRAVVSLLWPYSSSTKQCALLLADPDFRLRNKKGQVRVRFTGASAEAVAKARIGIGDELVLELGGAQWAGEETRVATPGKSVDGELVFGGQLALTVKKKADGGRSNARIQVNQSTPPPEVEPEQPISNGNHATPSRAAPLWMRHSMGGSEATPIYSSPAFVKRMSLSGDKTSWDPFADVENELGDDAGPRKRQRISFGGVKRWKLSDRTPSPEKEAPTGVEVGSQKNGAIAESPTQSRQSFTAAQRISGPPNMPPPPLPRLQLPPEPQFFGQQQHQRSTDAENDGPSTPKLHPVPSSALPLPSPFPTEASQVQFDTQVTGSGTGLSVLEALVEASETAREAEGLGRHDAELQEVAAEGLSSIVANKPELVPPGTSASEHRIPGISPAASLASTVEIERDDELSTHATSNANEDAHRSMSENREQPVQHSIPEYLSDTEEDEDMYYDHMRRRFPSVTESGRVRVDHQEEGYYDDLSQVNEDDAEEVIDADAMGEAPSSDESDEESDEDEGTQESDGDAVVEIQETPEPDTTAPAGTNGQPAQRPQNSTSNRALEALLNTTEKVRAEENRETLKTPARPPPGLFGFDGAANDTPFQPKSTPQSEKERIMAKTFSSLFGFKASPSPELPKQQQVQTPTPAMPPGRLPEIVKDGLESKQADASQDISARTNVVPEEAADAVQETGDSLPVSDIQDGSLLSAVLADDARDESSVVEETLQEIPVIGETPQVDVEMQDAADDPVPDGISINQGLGEAIAPKTDDNTQQPPPSSAPKPTQITIIDLGDSSDEDEQLVQTPQQEDLRHATVNEPTTLADVPRREMPSLSQATQRPPPTAARHTTQDSVGSALQSDMLNTTQTTVDRSEIATPIAEDINTVIPDTSQEDALWLNQGQQDGFFADQIQDAGFEGAAIPQLTQQPTGAVTDPYRYFSFQSATSVATDNSDNLPPTAVQSFAQDEQQVDLEAVDWPVQDEVRITEESSTMQLDPAPAGPEMADAPHAVSQELQIEKVARDTDMREAGETPVREPETSHSIEQDTMVVDVDGVQTQQFSQQAQRQGLIEVNSSLDRRLSQEIAVEQEMSPAVKEAITQSEVLAESRDVTRETIPPSQQASYPALPVSPEESQHRLESQPFETQLPYTNFTNELPLTPQLTQGDSLTGNQLQVVVQEADEELVSPGPTTPRRTRRSEGTSDETVESPAKKTPMRRSHRKTQEDTEASDKLVEETQGQSQGSEAFKPQRRRRSAQQDNSQPLLSPAKETPVRRSPRKPQTTTETRAEVPERNEDEASEKANSQASFQQPSPKLVQKTPIRRSTRRQQAESQASGMAAEEMETTTPVKTTTRKSARKDRIHGQNGDVAGDDHMEEDDMEDTISVTPPSKLKTRQSARKAQAETKDVEEEAGMPDAQLAVPKRTPAASRKSFASQLGQVPAVIADWFSPRRSSRLEHETEEPPTAGDVSPPPLTREKSNGLLTKLSYYTPLSNLEEKVNPASQYQTDNAVDVLAVVTDDTKAPECAKGGPRDYFTIFRIADPSLPANDSVRVEVFRPWHSVLPRAQVGDVVLLRAFAVKTRKRKPYLISADASAWCVWRYGESASGEKRPATRKRGASFSSAAGAREEVKGPPVELGEQEREKAVELRGWWVENKKEIGRTEEERVQPSSPASPRTTRTTRSQKL